jgi:hypothetical protein
VSSCGINSAMALVSIFQGASSLARDVDDERLGMHVMMWCQSPCLVSVGSKYRGKNLLVACVRTGIDDYNHVSELFVYPHLCVSYVLCVACQFAICLRVCVRYMFYVFPCLCVASYMFSFLCYMCYICVCV